LRVIRSVVLLKKLLGGDGFSHRRAMRKKKKRSLVTERQKNFLARNKAED